MLYSVWPAGQVAVRACGSKRKSPGSEALEEFVLPGGLLVVQRIGLGLVRGLVLEALVALAHLVVGDQGRDVALVQGLHIGVAVIAGVGRVQRLGAGEGPGLLDHGQQHGLLRA